MKPVYSKTIEKPCGFLFARWSAGAKAFEYARPRNERIISDRFATYYAGQVGMKLVGAMAGINPSLRKAIVLRARYMDDYSQRCMREGIRQVVLLGAGYDSRYLRLDAFRLCRVFELDLPSTQVIKKTLTRRLLGRLPAHVTYVPINFAVDSITHKLMQAGFRRETPTLFIWEGVTLFLNEDIIVETLGRLAELGKGNRLTFDFVPPELIDDSTGHQGNKTLLDLCSSINEPLTFGCHPARMHRLLAGTGYTNTHILSLQDASRMYCGTSDIENAYFFATAEAGAASDATRRQRRADVAGDGDRDVGGGS